MVLVLARDVLLLTRVIGSIRRDQSQHTACTSRRPVFGFYNLFRSITSYLGKRQRTRGEAIFNHCVNAR